MTRDEIVASVNRLSVGYNVTWHEIAEDADEAIHRINSYLGAEYPLMSDILTEPNSIYAVKQVVDGHVRHISIFPDIYIRTIVIPFIASEILSRDEEFTTIYNKYAMDVENGLFTMFQNEFNRVPHLFRQKDTTGVFFPEDYEKVHPEIDRRTRYVENEFHIRYHLNQDDLIYTGASLSNNRYTWKESYSLQEISSTDEYLSTDYTHYYTFVGWYKDAICATPASESGTIYSDIDVYAKWTQNDIFNTFPMDISGTKYTTPILNKLVLRNNTALIIPRNINGFIINALSGFNFFHYATSEEKASIKRIELPYYGIKKIIANFFTLMPNLEEIYFYGNASESSVASNNTIIDTNNLLHSNNRINSVDNYLVDISKLDWSPQGTLSVFGTKVTKLTVPNSVSTITATAFVRANPADPANPVHSSISENPDASVLELQAHQVDVYCDWTSHSKPNTFALLEGQEIYEWDSTKYYKYVIHFKNPKEN